MRLLLLLFTDELTRKGKENRAIDFKSPLHDENQVHIITVVYCKLYLHVRVVLLTHSSQSERCMLLLDSSHKGRDN